MLHYSNICFRAFVTTGLIFLTLPLSVFSLAAAEETPDVDYLFDDILTAMNTSSDSERRFSSKENSIRLLDYFRNKRKDPQCNPETNVYPCGALDFLGCSGNKKFYSQSIIKLTWFEAWEFCRSNGMHLASVESNYEQVFMELFLPKPEAGAEESYWLAGTDFGREGLWFWMTNGHSFTFTNWRPGEPNNFGGAEHCVQMMATQTDHDTLKWLDHPCNVLGHVVCEEEYMPPSKLPDRIVEP